jgi:hypothetical protein
MRPCAESAEGADRHRQLLKPTVQDVSKKKKTWPQFAAWCDPRRGVIALGGLQIPLWLGSDPPMGWWLGLTPATLEFWVRFPNERNQTRENRRTLC